jgi:hypothetical protein
MCSVASGYKGQTFMEREDPWCKTADLGKPEYTIGVLTNGSTVEPECVCVMQLLTEIEQLKSDYSGCEKKLNKSQPISSDPATLKLQLAEQRVCLLLLY